ncbi:MAG TPA: diheme cytochrome c-553 [Flavisolibacter sp.]
MLHRAILAVAVPMLTGMLISCSGNEQSKSSEDIDAYRNKETASLVERGSYLVTVGGCNDCHTPKIFTPRGPVDDSSRTLSGHPAGDVIPPITGDPATPGNWVLLSPGLTAFAGPWGISFPANLTPDEATGLGSWTEEVFIKTLRTGKHLGQETGRDILPPMPWFNFAKMTDDDLRSVFAYLRSLPPISNRVPAPVTPGDLANMTRGAAKPSTASQAR